MTTPLQKQTPAAQRLSPFHHKQSSLGAKFSSDEFGWVLAEKFVESDKEKEATERGVGLADLSHLAKLKLNGRGLTAVISQRFHTSGNYSKGQLLIEGNGLYKNTLCAALSMDEAMLILRESLKEQVIKDLTMDEPARLTLVDISSTLAGFGIIGPNGRALLRKLTELNVNAEDFPNLSVTHTPIRHVPTIILRSDTGSLLAYQLYFERAYAEFMWDVALSAGKELGLVPLGSSTSKSLGVGWGEA